MKKKSVRLEKNLRLQRRSLPGDEFLFVQFLIATDVQSRDDIGCTFLRIVLAFAVLFTNEIVLQTETREERNVFCIDPVRFTIAEINFVNSF